MKINVIFANPMCKYITHFNVTLIRFDAGNDQQIHKNTDLLLTTDQYQMTHSSINIYSSQQAETTDLLTPRQNSAVSCQTNLKTNKMSVYKLLLK